MGNTLFFKLGQFNVKLMKISQCSYFWLCYDNIHKKIGLL